MLYTALFVADLITYVRKYLETQLTPRDLGFRKTRAGGQCRQFGVNFFVVFAIFVVEVHFTFLYFNLNINTQIILGINSLLIIKVKVKYMKFIKE